MALTKDKQALIEKLAGKSYRKWEDEVATNEGLALIKGKGELRSELIDNEFTNLLDQYAAKQLKDKSHSQPKDEKKKDSKATNGNQSSLFGKK